MLLTLPVKNEDGARAFASVQLNKGNEIALRTSAQWNMAGSHAWQTHAFVLDVPADASSLVLDVGLSGSGAVLLDEPKLEAAGPALSTTRTARATHPFDCHNYNPCTVDKPVPGGLHRQPERPCRIWAWIGRRGDKRLIMRWNAWGQG